MVYYCFKHIISALHLDVACGNPPFWSFEKVEAVHSSSCDTEKISMVPVSSLMTCTNRAIGWLKTKQGRQPAFCRLISIRGDVTGGSLWIPRSLDPYSANPVGAKAHVLGWCTALVNGCRRVQKFQKRMHTRVFTNNSGMQLGPFSPVVRLQSHPFLSKHETCYKIHLSLGPWHVRKPIIFKRDAQWGPSLWRPGYPKVSMAKSPSNALVSRIFLQESPMIFIYGIYCFL